jgi:asparagine synthase (glutamine-hydrolysing)
MCGIFAAIKTDGSFTDDEIGFLQSNMDCISYRGPDAKGFNVLSIKNSNDVILAHQRLSVIDLAPDSNQPMFSENNCIIFNGEVFNYIELRDELKKEGEVFNTASDTEVILKVYKRWGIDGFEKFNGMWAFILVDTANKKIIISRDRFSIKPLYYIKNKNTFYFGSEIKQLLPFLTERKANIEVLYKFLSQSLFDYSDETFFEGILKVPARHNIVMDMESKEVLHIPYWNFEPCSVETEEEAIEMFRELFYDSIRLRLRSDVKLGSLLSGGLDSSAITAVASKLSGDNFESFSVVSKEKKYSEESFIDLFNNRTGIKNTKVLFQPEMIPDNIEKVLNHQDEPFGSFSIIAQHLIFQKIKTETDIIVVLSGQGGDEALMGYNKYYFFNLRNKIRQGKIFEAASQVLGSLIYRTVITKVHPGHSRRYFPGINKKDYLLLNYEKEDIWRSDDIVKRQILDFEKYSVPALAHYEDRNSMAYGLEVRHPFLDHRLVNFTLGVSDTLKIKNGWTKYLLRKSITEMPDEIRWRRDKKGFITPDEKWMREDLKPLIVNSFKNSILADMGVIDAKKFLEQYTDFIHNRKSVYYNDIFRVFITELWAKKFLN